VLSVSERGMPEMNSCRGGAGSAFLAGTNILLRLADLSDPGRASVVRDVCTRPVSRNGFGLSSAETDARAKIIEAGVPIPA